MSAGVLALAVSCSPNKDDATVPAAASEQAKGQPADFGTQTGAIIPGEAGGVVEETFTASAVVRGVDAATRQVTVESEDGTIETFTAPPEMHNFDQLQVGDRVSATVVSRIIVYVDEKGPMAGASYDALVARAPKGAKPGALIAESFEMVGTVRSIDPATRRATIEFAEGETRTVSIRDDVDLTRYKAGDKVVIRITQQVTLLAEAP